MPRYAALLRGVMPMNAKMPDLKAAFESAGFTDVRTVLSSGNVAFTARAASEVTLERAKPPSPPELPIERDGARILVIKGREVFGAYLPTPKGPVFMTLIEKTFGKDVTTRTWDTVAKVARA